MQARARGQSKAECDVIEELSNFIWPKISLAEFV
jgi:hypothetical protein